MYQNVKHTWVKSRVVVSCFSLTGGCLDSQEKWSGYGHMRDIYIESVNVTHKVQPCSLMKITTLWSGKKISPYQKMQVQLGRLHVKEELEKK